MRAVLAGSFDPWTTGHQALALEAVKMFGSLKIYVLADSPNKKYKASAGDRIDIIKLSLPKEVLENVEVAVLYNTLPDVLEKTDVLVRGLRNNIDYEYESNLLASYNAISLNPVHAVYIMASHSYKCVSSSMVRELLYYKHPTAPLFVVESAWEKVQATYTFPLITLL